MNYNYKIDHFNLRLNFIYPFMTVILLFILETLFFKVIYFYLQIPVVSYLTSILLFIMLSEAIFSSFLKNGIDLPHYLVLVELGIFGLLLWLTVNGNSKFDIWIILIPAIITWWITFKLTGYFFLIGIDANKISTILTTNNKEKLGYQALEYPFYWHKIRKSIIIMNFFLLLCLAVRRAITVELLILTVTFTLLEIILFSALFYEKKKLDWKAEGLAYTNLKFSKWFTTIISIILIIIILTALFPVNFNGITMADINQWLNSLRSDNMSDLKFEQAPRQNQPNPVQQLKQMGEQKELAPWLRYTILAFLFILVGGILSLILGFVLTFILEDIQRSSSLARFFIDFFLAIKKIIHEIFSYSSEKWDELKTWQERRTKRKEDQAKVRDKKNEIKQLKQKKLPHNLREMIYFIYQSMIKLLTYKGRSKKPTQTPYEYINSISNDYPQIKKELKAITEVYVELIYSQHTLSEKIGSKLHQFWDTLRNKL